MRKINKKQRKSLVEAFNRKYGGINRIEKDGSIILCHGHTLWLDENADLKLMSFLYGEKSKEQ